MAEAKKKSTAKKGAPTSPPRKAAAPKRAAKAAPKPGARKSMPASDGQPIFGQEASRRIDERIRTLDDWRGATLAEMRRLILEADPEIAEEIKWIKPTNPWGVPVWSHGGIVCTGETYKEVVKLTFPKEASLTDPHKLFNSSLEGNARRAIDIREGESLDAAALKALVQEAVTENLQTGSAKPKSASKSGAARGTKTKRSG